MTIARSGDLTALQRLISILPFCDGLLEHSIAKAVLNVTLTDRWKCNEPYSCNRHMLLLKLQAHRSDLQSILWWFSAGLYAYVQISGRNFATTLLNSKFEYTMDYNYILWFAPISKIASWFWGFAFNKKSIWIEFNWHSKLHLNICCNCNQN